MTAKVAPQLARVVRELEDVTARAVGLADRLDDAAFTRRPAPDRWSPADCLAHLSLTSDVYFPLIRAAIAEGRAMPRARWRYRRDLKGWLLTRSLEPSARFRIKTPPRFEPTGVLSRATVIAEFAVRQETLTTLVREASGLDLKRLRIVSPFNPRLDYDLYSCFTVLAAHERRHLVQAETAASG